MIVIGSQRSPIEKTMCSEWDLYAEEPLDVVRSRMSYVEDLIEQGYRWLTCFEWQDELCGYSELLDVYRLWPLLREPEEL